VVASERRDLLRVVEHEHRVPELGLRGLLVDLEDELALTPGVVHLDAVLASDAADLVERHADVDGETGALLDQLRHRRPAPRGGEVEVAAAVGELGGAP
jgi:hypothetical protein